MPYDPVEQNSTPNCVGLHGPGQLGADFRPRPNVSCGSRREELSLSISLPVCPRDRTSTDCLVMSQKGRFCCRSLLLACADNDSIALTRFAAEADDDGAAEARAGTALLRVPAR